MMGAFSTPQLERMSRQEEAARLREEISLLEQQMSQLESYNQAPQVKCNYTQTEEADFKLASGSPTLAKRLHFEDELKKLTVQNQSVETEQKAVQHVTSTPKPNSGTYNSSSQDDSKKSSFKSSEPGSLESCTQNLLE